MKIFISLLFCMHFTFFFFSLFYLTERPTTADNEPVSLIQIGGGGGGDPHLTSSIQESASTLPTGWGYTRCTFQCPSPLANDPVALQDHCSHWTNQQHVILRNILSFLYLIPLFLLPPSLYRTVLFSVTYYKTCLRVSLLLPHPMLTWLVFIYSRTNIYLCNKI